MTYFLSADLLLLLLFSFSFLFSSFFFSFFSFFFLSGSRKRLDLFVPMATQLFRDRTPELRSVGLFCEGTIRARHLPGILGWSIVVASTYLALRGPLSVITPIANYQHFIYTYLGNRSRTASQYAFYAYLPPT